MMPVYDLHRHFLIYKKTDYIMKHIKSIFENFEDSSDITAVLLPFQNNKVLLKDDIITRSITDPEQDPCEIFRETGLCDIISNLTLSGDAEKDGKRVLLYTGTVTGEAGDAFEWREVSEVYESLSGLIQDVVGNYQIIEDNTQPLTETIQEYSDDVDKLTADNEIDKSLYNIQVKQKIRSKILGRDVKDNVYRVRVRLSSKPDESDKDIIKDELKEVTADFIEYNGKHYIIFYKKLKNL